MKKIPPKRRTQSREQYWQRLFDSYAAHSEDHLVSGWSYQGLHQRLSVYSRFLDEILLPEGSLVLDLGCGAGTYSRFLVKRGFQVIGMDYAPAVVKAARKRSVAGEDEYLCGDIYRLPFADNVFDHVVCIGVFQSLNDHRRALCEIRRVLVGKGRLFLMTLNKLEWLCILKRCLRWEDVILIHEVQNPRLMTYHPRVFGADMRRLGFHSVQVAPVQIVPEYFTGYSNFVAIWQHVPFFRYLTAHSFNVTAQK